VPRISAVFLDAGDTLLAADPPVDHVYRDAFTAYGVDADVETVHRAVHATWKEVHAARERGEERWAGPGGEAGFWRRFVAAVFARVGGGDMPEPLLTGLIAHFRQELHWTLYPEVPEVLAALRKAGLKLAVVSNWDSTLPLLLARLGLADAFDDVIVSAVVGVSKPHRGIFEEALRRSGVAPGAALHVGDSLIDDYDGARAAGLQALLVDRAGRHGPEVESIASLVELPARIAGRKTA
jgi:putative hydrolase of the HAD superfamily